MAVDTVVTPEERLRGGGYEAVVAAAERVGAEFAKNADEHDRASTYAFENVARLWAESLGNLTVPVADPSRRQNNSSVGAARLRTFAEQGEVLDERLWTRVAKLTGAGATPLRSSELRAGGRVAAHLLRPRLHHDPDPRLRPA